jgi:hypothetical protein
MPYAAIRLAQPAGLLFPFFKLTMGCASASSDSRSQVLSVEKLLHGYIAAQ